MLNIHYSELVLSNFKFDGFCSSILEAGLHEKFRHFAVLLSKGDIMLLRFNWRGKSLCFFLWGGIRMMSFRSAFTNFLAVFMIIFIFDQFEDFSLALLQLLNEPNFPLLKIFNGLLLCVT